MSIEKRILTQTRVGKKYKRVLKRLLGKTYDQHTRVLKMVNTDECLEKMSAGTNVWKEE